MVSSMHQPPHFVQKIVNYKNLRAGQRRIVMGILQCASSLHACAVPQQLLPRLLSAGQFKCPHCRTTQGLPEGLGTQQEPQHTSAAPDRVRHHDRQTGRQQCW